MEDIKPDQYYKWDKDKFIQKKIEGNRNLDWFQNRYKRNLTIGIVLAGLTFFNTCTSLYLFKAKNTEIEVYLTASSGKIIQYENTEERIKALRKAIPVARSKNNGR